MNADEMLPFFMNNVTIKFLFLCRDGLYCILILEHFYLKLWWEQFSLLGHAQIHFWN